MRIPYVVLWLCALSATALTAKAGDLRAKGETVAELKGAIRIGEVCELNWGKWTCHFYVPKKVRRDRRSRLPTIVLCHGLGEDPAAYVKGWSAYAEKRRWAVFAPLFRGDHANQYQYLGVIRNLRCDHDLLNMIEAAKKRIPILRTERIFIYGHSAGAQFAHRFAIVHPDRILMGVAASAGGYCYPDPEFDFPRGSRVRDDDWPSANFDAFVQLHFGIVVGAEDSQEMPVDKHGTTRLERARNFHRLCREHARKQGLPFRLGYAELSGVGHAGRPLGDWAREFFTARLRRRR